MALTALFPAVCCSPITTDRGIRVPDISLGAGLTRSGSSGGRRATGCGDEPCSAVSRLTMSAPASPVQGHPNHTVATRPATSHGRPFCWRGPKWCPIGQSHVADEQPECLLHRRPPRNTPSGVHTSHLEPTLDAP
jgi:hypothetical protein